MVKKPMMVKKGAPAEPVTVRLDAAMLAAVDKAMELVQSERPDTMLTRGDVIRVLVAEALRARKVAIR